MDEYCYGHRVKPGENLTSIAKFHGWNSAEALIQFQRNKSIVNPNVITPGQEIFIPYKKADLLMWEKHYQEAMNSARDTMNEYNSAENNIYRAVRKSFSDVEEWWSNLVTAKTAFDFKKLLEKLEHLSGITMQLAVELQSARFLKLYLASVTKILDALGKLQEELDKNIAILSDKEKRASINRSELIRDGKAVMRHVNMIVDLVGTFRDTSKLNHKPQDLMALGAGDISDLATVDSLKKIAGKTVDQTFLIGKMGLYLGDLLASCTDKAEMELFIYGFEEYDKQIGEELEAAMLKSVELAQGQLSAIRMQLGSPIYAKYA